MKKSGDPNLTFWICNEAVTIFKLQPKNLVQQASLVPSGLAHLKAYARRREEIEILAELKIKELASVPRGEEGKPLEEPGLAIAITSMMQAYNQTNFDLRIKHVKRAKRELECDAFFKGMLEEMIQVQESLRQAQSRELGVDASNADVIRHFNDVAIATKNRKGLAEIAAVQKLTGMTDSQVYTYIVQSHARKNDWDPAIRYIEAEQPKVSPYFLLELCMSSGKQLLATKAAHKLPSKDDRILALIDLCQWKEAVELCFKLDRKYYLDDIRQKGP